MAQRSRLEYQRSTYTNRWDRATCETAERQSDRSGRRFDALTRIREALPSAWS